MEARVPWKDGYYGPAISKALGLEATIERPSPLRVERGELVCPGVTTEQLARVCATIDHAAERKAAFASRPPTIEDLQQQIDALKAQLEGR